MPWIPERWDGPNQAYFVTVVTKYREPVFADNVNSQRLLTAFKEVHAYHKFRLLALVILPDHWHSVLWPYPQVIIETVVGSVKQNMLWQVWKVQKRPAFWQERFLDHRIRNDRDLVYHVEYVWYNPVKHGLVKRPEDYNWLFINRKLLSKMRYDGKFSS